MTIFLYDLEPLEDILDTLEFEEEENIFSEDYALELVETTLILIEEYIKENPIVITDPDFCEIVLEDIKDIFYIQMEDSIMKSDYVEDDMNDILEYAFDIYTTTFSQEWFLNGSEQIEDSISYFEKDNEEFDVIKKTIESLREIPQPEQRTPEWYKFRWNLITASNAWKALESQSTINQLIYEKCQPLKDFSLEPSINEEVKMINTNTTLHWGQKYEPLSVMMYEYLYNSKVEDFGCIQHPIYKFIGASPDGIIIESNTDRYGRMLEIKNIVNREITGIPKKEYWVQMQLQMEVCNLDKCDFLETKFTEYSDYNDYKNDSSIGVNTFTRSKDDKFKGIIIHFHKKEGSPHYEYMPLNILTEADISSWEESIISKYESEPYNYTFLKFIYWKLEKLSCVLVLRNKEWFKNSIGQLEKVWKIIEHERINGYEHRAPSKKIKKDTVTRNYVDEKNKHELCFLQLFK